MIYENHIFWPYLRSGRLAAETRGVRPTSSSSGTAKAKGQLKNGTLLMKHYAGLDISTDSTSICIVSETGAIVMEIAVPTNVAAIWAALTRLGAPLERVGLEAGSTGEWLTQGLVARGLPVIPISARHAHAVLKQTLNKTDRNDARGIAQLMRAGVYRSVHVKSVSSQHVRDLLAARRLLRSKCIDLELGMAGILRSRGVRVARSVAAAFESSVRAAIAGSAELRAVIGPLLAARNQLRAQFTKLDLAINAIARRDPVCRRLMTAPGIGPIVSLTFRAVIDKPFRFSRSRDVAAHIGLTPRTRQSGTMDWRGRISKLGDKQLRTALYNAAVVILGRTGKVFALKTWALEVAARRGVRKARVALARRLSVILLVMWKTGRDFRTGDEGA